FDDGAEDEVAKVLQANRVGLLLGVVEPELLRDDGAGGCGRLADAKGEMPGGAAHAHDDVPARRGACVLGEPTQRADSVMARGFEAEGWRRAGQVEIVVDRFGNVGDAN